MSTSRNSKRSGLRYLWIPGRKRSHPKGRFDSTHKHVNHSSGQKKNQPWSLGGEEGHRDIIKTESDNFDSVSPSISRLGSVSCAAGAPAIAIAAKNMPALTDNKQNKCALVDTIGDYEDLPSPPKDGEKKELISEHVTARELLGDTTSNHNLRKIDEDFEPDNLPSPPNENEHEKSDIASEHSPQKKRPSTNRKINGNHHPEVDIDSIESMSEYKLSHSAQDLPDSALKTLHLNDTQRMRNKRSTSKPDDEEEDEDVIKCLYYTLICCDCTIS